MQYLSIICSAISVVLSFISIIKIFTTITERFVKIETKFNLFKDETSTKMDKDEEERGDILQKIHEHDCIFAKIQTTLETVNKNTERIEQSVKEISERIK